jgi:selenocysteine lyase/cysteine desulfurase
MVHRTDMDGGTPRPTGWLGNRVRALVRGLGGSVWFARARTYADRATMEGRTGGRRACAGATEPTRPKEGLSLTPQAFRRHFPALADQAYFASCSEGALSDRVIVAMEEFMHSWRAYGAPWQAWMARVEDSRAAFARRIGAEVEEVAVVSCASEGAYQVASSLLREAGRDTIVTNDLEFPSIAHVWLAQAAASGGKVHHIPAPGGRVGLDDYAAAIDAGTALVSAPLAAYANGLRLPVADIARLAHERGARLFVDAYQAVGVLDVDVRALDCDYLVAGSLKYLLGAPGIAFLYVRRDLVDAHRPTLTGWFGRVDPFAFDPRSLDYAAGARRFETGTPAIPAAYAAAAGLSLVNELDARAVERHVAALADRLQAGLLALGARLFSPLEPALRGPQVAVRADRPDELAAFLARRAVVASPRGRALRLSLHYYNDVGDIDRAVDAIRAYMAEAPLEATRV